MDWTEKRDGNGQKMGGPAGGSGAFGGIGRSAFLYGRGADYTGNDNNGRLTVSGTVEGSVGGWYLMSGNAENGSVTKENGIHIENGNIFGGYTHDGNASGNTAALTGTWVKGGPDGDYSTGAVFGGYTDRGSAKGNTLTINEYSTIDFQAVGGQTYDGSADNNEVCIDKSFIGRDPRDLSEEEVAQAPDAVNGGSGDSASVNKVEMTDSMSWGRVTGGAAFTGEANGNTVTISGGHVVSVAGAASVMGGLSNGGDVRENHVTIQNGQKGAEVEYSVMGGYTLRGDAAGNTVTVSDETLRDEDGTRAHGGLYGGLTEWGNADGNRVTVTNVILDGKNLTDVGNGTDAIYGGRSEEGTVAGNGVEISGADTVVTASAIVGGWSESGSVLDNDVTISGGNVTGGFDSEGNVTGTDVYGGRSKGGDVSWNWVSMISGTMNAHFLYGGSTESGSVSNNGVAIYGGTTDTMRIVGGETKNGDADENHVLIMGDETKASSYIIGGSTETGSVSDNQVTVVGEKVTTLALYGGWVSKEGDASGNEVMLAGGESRIGAVAGGYTEKGTAADNEAWLAGSSWSDYVAGKETDIFGGYTSDGDALRNTVIVGRGTDMTGLSDAALFGGYTENGTARDNEVLLYGGRIKGDVAGAGVGDGGTAVGNTVTLTGEADVSEAALYGWKLTGEKGGAPAETADNALIIDDWTGSTQSAKHFDTIRFQGVAWDPGGTLLTITNGAEGDLENTKIDAGNVVILGDRTPQAGESMTFVKDETADTGLSEEQAAGGISQGVVTAGTADWDMPEAGKTLNYTITGVFRNAQTDAVAENRLAGAAFVNQGADIAADSLHLLDDGYHWGTRTFGAVYGNRSTYDAAGDFKINGWSTIVGAGNVHEVKGGRLAWGVFYENGTGNYRTWNEFNNEMFRGDGSLLYNGGGAAVRLTKDSGMYYEASLRAGTLSSSMTDAVRDGYGNSYGFDSDSTYWGGHIGAGKLVESGRGEWDIYGKYFHTEIDGDSFTMGGDAFSFDSVTSDRLRLGARYTAEKGRAWSLYYGAAYEYEFSGDSRMKAGPWDTEQSLQGSTVFGEIGAVMREGDSPWSVDINLRGYAGEREGFSGMVMAAYSF